MTHYLTSPTLLFWYQEMDMENLKNIQLANLIAALELGEITWFKYFEEIKKIEINEESLCRIQFI